MTIIILLLQNLSNVIKLYQDFSSSPLAETEVEAGGLVVGTTEKGQDWCRTVPDVFPHLHNLTMTDTNLKNFTWEFFVMYFRNCTTKLTQL